MDQTNENDSQRTDVTEGTEISPEPVLTGPTEVPIMPLRNTVLFPRALIPVSIGRKKNLDLLQDVMSKDRVLAVFMQKDATTEDPKAEDLHEVGTLAVVTKMVRITDDTTHVLVQGVGRIRLDAVIATTPHLRGRVVPLAEVEQNDIETQALARTALEQLDRLLTFMPDVPREVAQIARGLSDHSHLADFLASLIDLDPHARQAFLEQLDTKQRLRTLVPALERKINVLAVGRQIQEEVKKSIDDRQREAILREQLQAIQRQLGDEDAGRQELEQLRLDLERAGLPEEASKEAERDLARLARMPPQSAEYSIIRTYLEWLAELPWNVSTPDVNDLAYARRILDEDHHGLDRVKERLIEFLAVRSFKPDARTPILCFAGPPGTGKTSLGRSIARALGRNFARQSLGGVHDEAEIRGHRRTYVGAMPGKLLQAIRRAGSNNPVIMLDEIDKIGRDFRGDPSSALLEVLDPEQNRAFVDHYLNVPFDLSKVLFVCTANYLDPVPAALRDRMEVIELAGYTEREKLEIAKRHLVPKAISEHGLEQLGIVIEDDALLETIRGYTRDAGLRSLERHIAAIIRKTAKETAEGKRPAVEIGRDRVRTLLGPERFAASDVPGIDEPGGALGLAWTPVGGEVLVIEATAMPGTGFRLTGQLGDVMKESAQAALSFVRSRAVRLGIDPAVFGKSEIHLHVPAGAIPKDGPSAGTAMCLALISLFTGRLPRAATAMTGEITLRGRVLPVGGIKEKILGAHRAGLTTVIIPAENHKDLEEIPPEVLSSIEIKRVTHMDEIIEAALSDQLMESPATPRIPSVNGGLAARSRD